MKIAEYRPDQEGNLSIWAGNLSFAGESFGMSVHGSQEPAVDSSSCSPGEERLQLLPGLRLSPCSQAGRQAHSQYFQGTPTRGLGTSLAPSPAQLAAQDCRLWQQEPSQGCRHLFCLSRDCRIPEIREDPKHTPGNFVLGCSGATASSPWCGIFSF